ncbi:MAG: hypothetical protein ACI9B7_000334 [Oleispira sp.]|jgi:hypothetical protein
MKAIALMQHSLIKNLQAKPLIATDYVDQLAIPFDVLDGGNIRSVRPMTEPKQTNFQSGFNTNTYRFDTPDQLTLPMSSTANSVSARISYDDKYTVGFLSLMVRSGFWSLINRPFFKKK